VPASQILETDTLITFNQNKNTFEFENILTKVNHIGDLNVEIVELSYSVGEEVRSLKVTPGHYVFVDRDGSSLQVKSIDAQVGDSFYYIMEND
jgi:predicted homoserine dehydrogenase-like protein